jgi:ABC-2 type transport system ATP-binding protein
MAEASIPMLSTDAVSCRWGRRTVLNDVTVNVPSGVTALVGSNGAGKSTLMGVLATVHRPATGTIWYDGQAIGRDQVNGFRRQLGYLPQRFDLMSWSTVHRNVAYAAWCNGIPARDCYDVARTAISDVGLSGQATKRAGTLSGGQRQRVGLACAIAHRPTVLLLDEPTAGLDAAHRAGLRQHLATIGEHATVLISTHLADDIAAIADRVIALAAGRVTFAGPTDALVDIGSHAPTRGLSDLEAGLASVSGIATLTESGRS